MTEIITRIRDIVKPFDCIIVDQWGVMHNGREASKNTKNALLKIKELGKCVVTLSNSSKPRRETKMMLNALGFEQGQHYDYIVTSGADMQDQLREPKDEFYLELPKNPRLFVLATYDGNLSLLKNMPCSVVENLEQADALIITGLAQGQGAKKELAKLEATLAIAKTKNLPLICPNADMAVAMPDGSIHPCAGVIAKYYTQQGGKVRMHGKPDPHIYYSCFRLAGGKIPINKTAEKCLAVGDSLANDIKGAQNAKCGASLFVASGIHQHDLEMQNINENINAQKLKKLTNRVNITPTFAINEVRW